MTSTAELSAFAVATRARAAAAQADAAAWGVQVRSWPHPSTGPDEVLVALHQAALHLQSAADRLDPPNPYATTAYLRSTVITVTAMLLGAIGLGLTLSGLAMAVVVATHVTLVMSVLHVASHRWTFWRGPRSIHDADADLAMTAGQLGTEVAALLDALRPEHSLQRAAAQAPLQAADKLVQLAIRTIGP